MTDIDHDDTPVTPAELAAWIRDEVTDELLDEECDAAGITDELMRDVFKMGARAMSDRVRYRLGGRISRPPATQQLRQKLAAFETFLGGRQPSFNLATEFLEEFDPEWGKSQQVKDADNLLRRYREHRATL